MLKFRESFYKSYKPIKPRKINDILSTDLYNKKYDLLKTALHNEIKVDTKYRIAAPHTSTRKRFVTPQKNIKKEEDDDQTENYSQVNLINHKKLHKVEDFKNILDELENILNSTTQKTNKFIYSFKELKSGNHNFINKYNEIMPPIEKRIYKKFLDLNNSIINDKEQDLINELDYLEQNKAAQKIYKMNPLTLRKDKDLYLYYIAVEKGIKFDANNKKYIRFLENIRDYLDYVKIDKNTTDLDFQKEIKKRNNKYQLSIEDKIKNEQINNLIKQRNQSIIDAKEAEKMIKKTKVTVENLLKDKNLFDIENSFTNKRGNKTSNNFFKKKKIGMEYSSTMYSFNNSTEYCPSEKDKNKDYLKIILPKDDNNQIKQKIKNKKTSIILNAKKANIKIRNRSNINIINSNSLENKSHEKSNTNISSLKNKRNYREFMNITENYKTHKLSYDIQKTQYNSNNRVCCKKNKLKTQKFNYNSKKLKIKLKKHVKLDSNINVLFEATKNSNKLLNKYCIDKLYEYLNNRGIKPETVKAHRFGSLYHFDNLKHKISKINIEAEEKSISKESFPYKKMEQFEKINELDNKICNLNKKYAKAFSKL